MQVMAKIRQAGRGILARRINTYRETGCRGKRRYCTKDAAERAAAKMLKKKGVQLEPYPCPFCRKWHIGKSNEGVIKLLEKEL